MYKQVGVAANGRSKVAIAIGRQTEVSHIFFTITRFLHRTQHNAVYDGSVWFVFDPSKYVLKIGRLNIVDVARRINS